VRAEMMGIALEDDRHYQKWIGFVRDAMSCLEVNISEEGRVITGWKHLPNSGGLYDQDEFFMRVWEIVKVKYIMALTDREFQNTLKSKRGGGLSHA